MTTNDRPTKARSLLRHIPGRVVGQATTGPGGLLAELFVHGPIDGAFVTPAVSDPLLVWIASGEARVAERDLGGDWSAVDVGKGDLFVVDSDEPYELSWDVAGGSFEALHVHLGAPLLEAAAAEIFGSPQRPTLREASGIRDDTISALLDVVDREVRRSSAVSPTLLGGIGQALAVCLLRSFPNPDGRPRRRGSLPAFRLRAVANWMTEHLSEPFSLAAVASVAEMSPFHFSRTFRRSTGLSPQRYFVGLRIAEAQRLLRETEQSITAIALSVGYTSPSHFAQTFHRVSGLTPSSYRDASTPGSSVRTSVAKQRV